eukprot:GHVU01152103.1.p1 GENE.GHVU01152103.1~~GHVU01152103.1.p1  ORF type:complete len:431 (+),score=44.82 GHVU01152103.1:122-1414(+)
MLCADVDLQECWNEGRRLARAMLVPGISTAVHVEKCWADAAKPGHSLLCPHGRPVGVRTKPRGGIRSNEEDEDEDSDEEEDLENEVPGREEELDADGVGVADGDGDDDECELDEGDASTSLSVLPPEMYSDEPVGDAYILVDGTPVHKRYYIRAKSQHVSISNDRLRRVRSQPRFDAVVHESISDPESFDGAVCLRDPACALCVVDSYVCLVVFAIVSMRIAKRSLFAMPVECLDESVRVVGQPLRMYRDDEHCLKWGLKTGANLFPVRCVFSGKMVQLLSPATVAGSDEPYFEFDFMTLGAVAHELWEKHGSQFNSQRNLFPAVPPECVPLDHTGSPLTVSDSGTECMQASDRVKCRLCDVQLCKRDVRAHMRAHTHVLSPRKGPVAFAEDMIARTRFKGNIISCNSAAAITTCTIRSLPSRLTPFARM